MSELGRFESFYKKLPIGAQNLGFSLWGLWSRHIRYGGDFSRILHSLIQSDFDSEHLIRERQTAGLRGILAHARDTVPYYRDRLQVFNPKATDTRLWEQFTELPILTKQEVRNAGIQLGSRVLSARQYVEVRTSGTTGTPLVIRQTRYAMRFQWAVWWRHRARYGVHFGDPFLSFGARVPAMGRGSIPWRENRAIRQTYLVASLLTGRALEQTLDMIQRRHFVFYTGYPSAMYVLARQMLDRGMSLDTPPRMIFTGSDALTPGFREVIEHAFRAPISDNFGSAELCGNLSQCPEGRYHVDHELGVVEFLPIPNCDDNKLRRLVCTGLVNEAMPFIRYELGDYVRLADGPCRCGRSSPSAISIEGREEDFVVTPDGRLITGFNQVLEWIPGVIEAQVVQERPDEIEVRLVAPEPINEQQRAVLLREVSKRAGDSLRVTVRRVDTIPRMANGKFRAVVSSLRATQVC